MAYDFDKIIDRSGSGDLKHNVLKERYGRDDLLPLWVADMDFETPAFITEALRQRLEHSLFSTTNDMTTINRNCIIFYSSVFTSKLVALRSSQNFGYDLVTTCGLLMRRCSKRKAAGAKASAIR